MFAKPLILISLYIVTFAAQAQECLVGTWKGTIGSIPVVVEFDPAMGADNTLAGRYYYRSSLEDLLLVKDQAGRNRWKEIDPKGRVTGYLVFNCDGRSLNGEWKSTDGSRTQPVSATADSLHAYSKTRLDSVKPSVSAGKALGSSRYEVLSVPRYPSVAGLRLIGRGTGIAKINEILMEQFRSALNDDMTCRAYGRHSRGEDHGYETAAEWNIVAWNRASVVINHSSSGYCGGAHPYSGWGAAVYDVSTGEREDVSKWLAEEYQKGIAGDSALGRLLLKLYRPSKGTPADDECLDVVQLSASEVWPTSTGMSFQTWAPYAAHACIEDVVVPYNKMISYLSPYGKTRVQEFRVR